jgi:hypothetical protein
VINRTLIHDVISRTRGRVLSRECYRFGQATQGSTVPPSIAMNVAFHWDTPFLRGDVFPVHTPMVNI